MSKVRKSAAIFYAAVIVFCAVGFNALTVVPRAYAADPNVDIAAQLTGPSSELRGKPFTYDLTVSNVGSTDASGTTFTFTAGSGSTGVKIACASATGGAVCPTDLAASGLNAAGSVGTFPAGGVVHLTVTGYFGYDSSATATLSVNPPVDSTDINPASNTVSQQTSLSGDAVVSVTKTQDKTSVASGEARTYTVTYRNDGPADLRGVTIGDVYSRAPGSQSLSLDSTSCSATGGAVCPAVARQLPYVNNIYNGVGMDVFSVYSPGGTQLVPLDFPAGSSLTFTYVMTETVQCSTQATLNVKNTANMDRFPAGIVVKNASGNITTNEQATIDGTITGIPACPQASVSVTKTQDKVAVANGEARTYTVVYGNDGPADLRGVTISEVYRFVSSSSSVSLDSTSCVATGTAVCPTVVNSLPYTDKYISWLNLLNPYGAINLEGIKVDLPANSSLTFTFVVRETAQCTENSSATVGNTASMEKFPSGVTVIDQRGNTISMLYQSVSGTIDNIPECPTATVSVTKTQDKDTVANGEARTYTVTYRSDGPADLRGVALSDMYVGDSSSTKILDSISCTATGGAVCPTRVDPLPYVQKGNSYFYPSSVYGDFTGARVDMPANSSLTFTYVVREIFTCSAPTTVNVTNQAILNQFPSDVIVKDINGNTLVANALSTVTGTIDTSSTTDVSTVTSISNDYPDPLGDLTATSTISNSCHTATDVPVTVKLPDDGFLVPQDAVPTCMASGGATCPTDLRFDVATNSILGTVGSIPAGGNVVLSLLGTAGVIPPTTASFKVTSTAPAAGDNIPIASSPNESNATFAYSNVQSPVAAKVVVSGGPAGGWSGSMSGTLVCQAQGSFPFTLDVVNGASQVTSVVAALWEHDTCTATLTRPDPPAGYKWDQWSAGPELTIADIIGAQQFDFGTSLIAEALPAIPPVPDPGTTVNTNVPPANANASPLAPSPVIAQEENVHGLPLTGSQGALLLITLCALLTVVGVGFARYSKRRTA